MGEWLIKWKKRGESREVNDNFLWKHDRLYVMDNHRLALWCWWQHLDKHSKWNFLHIDRHYDASWHEFRPWIKDYTLKHKQSLNSFRKAKASDEGGEMHLYRWDIMTSALHVLNGEQIDNWVFATGEEGVPLDIPQLQTLNPWKLPAYLKWFAESTEDNIPYIVDIDIDYFTHKENDGSYGQVFSSEYLHELGLALNKGLRNNKFGVVTIALSPDTTGTWKLAEKLCWTLLKDLPSLSELQDGSPRVISD